MKGAAILATKSRGFTRPTPFSGIMAQIEVSGRRRFSSTITGSHASTIPKWGEINRTISDSPATKGFRLIAKRDTEGSADPATQP
jgi:hypothetical protein